jgi:tryptophan-rich sensory protein
MRRNVWSWLLGYLVAVSTVAIVTSEMTAPAISTWYSGLAKPNFNPPNWVFGPAWTLLYTMMAVAAWRVHVRTHVGELTGRIAGRPSNRTALTWWWLQLALNAAWSVIFFRMHAIGWALADIVVLLLAIAMTTYLFWRVSGLAGALLMPNLAWVAFATALNFQIWRLN